MGFDLGYALPKGGGGLMFTLEPKCNLKDNLSLGIRWQLAGMSKEIVTDATGSVTQGAVGANTSFLATVDHYFHKEGSSFAPYIGGGAGVFILGNVSASSSGDGGVSGGSKFGGLIRTGFEAGKFRMGVEYNLIPKTHYEIIESVGKPYSVSNSYFGVSVGFFLGGGWWGK